MTGTQAWYENLPESAGMPLAHRHTAAIPSIEIANDADSPRVGRPDRKRNAFGTVMQHGMRAEFLIACEMIALDEQVHVQITEHRRETVDVVEFPPMTAAPDPQPVAERGFALRHAGDKKTGGMDTLALRGDFAGCRVDNGHALRVRQHCANIDPGRRLVHAEKRKRIVVAPRDDGLDLAAKTGRHDRPAPPPPSPSQQHARSR